MTGLVQTNAEALRIRALFEAKGAQLVETDILQPAETLLDLYGEDIRGRAYVTHDGLRGEMMLRPDFTVPVVQWHMETNAEPARYTYSGKVFRMQEDDDRRPNEYLQVGYEVFDGKSPSTADAEVFTTIADALSGLPVRAATGDLGILMAAVRGLDTTDARKAALLRHVWRPRRFRNLLDRFGGKTPAPASRTALLAQSDPLAGVEPHGLRSVAEVEARITALRADASAAPIASEQIRLLDELLSLRETCPNVLSNLRDIAVDMPSISDAVSRFAERLDALSAAGVDVDTLEYEGNFGRTTLEYYDGFVFGFYSTQRPDLPPVATGGRYDALTSVLGGGRAVPAVGGVIRPEITIALKDQA
ncbi:ATP phosphoribosyltransferase regulatory subunit [Marivivens niveibacter]|uniref:ATP phosphoribosyltransferase regulatory subunit n=1 Tax=Marivivens niveibacter TaxID=1930667 RepID=A0A251X0Z2_9RHOB|nr:ATP phosphoribosyltransferase regulatory subunit [Marivivens niveibacter]OUD10292.1 ATP phosphoribosyltransferase regulatory subunit [Marivivens niveibacter]